MKAFSFNGIMVVLVLFVFVMNISFTFAATECKSTVVPTYMSAVVSNESLLLADSSPDSNQLGFLEAGDRLSVFPEMSTGDYFFVMASTGNCSESYGWVPAQTVSFSDAKYADIPENHWAQDAVRNLDDQGIMVGNADGFNGEKSVSRYELATTLNRHLKQFQAYKNSVQLSLESIAVNGGTLSGREAARMDRLIRHLEGIEVTENTLKNSYANLEKRINNNEQTINVIEQMAVNNGELIAKVDGRVTAFGKKVARISGVEGTVRNLMKRIDNLEINQGRTNSNGSAVSDSAETLKLHKELNQLKSRVNELESSKEVIMASTATVTDSQPAQRNDFEVKADTCDSESSEIEEFDFPIDGFGEDTFYDGEESNNYDEQENDNSEQNNESLVAEESIMTMAAKEPSFEQPAPSLSTNVSQAHSALREALNKGLVIRRHPLDAQNDGEENIVNRVSSEPNRVLVRALTRQIAEISSSLSSVGNRIEDIERGVL